MNMSVSQLFEVPDNSSGLLKTSIQSLSLTLVKQDVNLTFRNTSSADFSTTLSRSFNSIKDYFLINTNQLAQDEKLNLQAMLQIVLD